MLFANVLASFSPHDCLPRSGVPGFRIFAHTHSSTVHHFSHKVDVHLEKFRDTLSASASASDGHVSLDFVFGKVRWCCEMWRPARSPSLVSSFPTVRRRIDHADCNNSMCAVVARTESLFRTMPFPHTHTNTQRLTKKYADRGPGSNGVPPETPKSRSETRTAFSGAFPGRENVCRAAVTSCSKAKPISPYRNFSYRCTVENNIARQYEEEDKARERGREQAEDEESLPVCTSAHTRGSRYLVWCQE